MAAIDPILDSYIEQIIKKNQVGTPDPNKTSGEELRELVKLLRDHFEAVINDKVTILQSADSTLGNSITIQASELTKKASLIAANDFQGNQNVNGDLTISGTLNAKGPAVIGTTSVPANLTVNSNVHKIKVLPSISNGLSSIEFNTGQSSAYRLADSNGNQYLNINSTPGELSVSSKQAWIIDNGTLSPLTRTQARISGTGAGSKVYGLKSNLPYIIPMVNGMSLGLSAKIKVQDANGNAVIHAGMVVTLKKIGGVITVLNSQVTTYCDNGSSGYSIGAEPVSGNSGISLYFSTGASDITVYTGAFYEIAYC